MHTQSLVYALVIAMVVGTFVIIGIGVYMIIAFRDNPKTQSRMGMYFAIVLGAATLIALITLFIVLLFTYCA